MTESKDPGTVRYRAKSVLQSRTLIVNVLTAIAAILALPELVGILPVQTIPILAVVNPMINVILRMYTVRPVAMSLPGTPVVVAVEKLD